MVLLSEAHDAEHSEEQAAEAQQPYEDPVELIQELTWKKQQQQTGQLWHTICVREHRRMDMRSALPEWPSEVWLFPEFIVSSAQQEQSKNDTAVCKITL